MHKRVYLMASLRTTARITAEDNRELLKFAVLKRLGDTKYLCETTLFLWKIFQSSNSVRQKQL